jgi:MFS family permease
MHMHITLPFLLKGEINKLYFNAGLRSLAISMINIFIPLYLLNLDYPVKTILLFFALSYFMHAILVIPAAKIGSKRGFKYLIFMSVPFLVVFYFFLYTLATRNWPLAVIAVLFGITNSLFWTGYHIDFSKITHKRKRGSEISKSFIVRSLFSAIGPLTGGVILTFFGFKPLFVIVSIILLLSTLPLISSKDFHDKKGFNLKNTFNKRKLKDFLAFFGHGVEGGVRGVVWPLILFFIVKGSYTSLGLIYTLALIFSSVAIYLTGKYSNLHRKLILKLGAVLTSITWLIRAFIQTITQAFFVDSFYGISRTSTTSAFNAITYDKAKKDPRYILFREISINLGVSITLVILSFIPSLKVGLFFASIGMLFFLLF